MNLDEELENLKRLMVEGKIQFYQDFTPELKKVMRRSDGTVIEKTVSPRLKEVLLEIRGKGE